MICSVPKSNKKLYSPIKSRKYSLSCSSSTLFLIKEIVYSLPKPDKSFILCKEIKRVLIYLYLYMLNIILYVQNYNCYIARKLFFA